MSPRLRQPQANFLPSSRTKERALKSERSPAIPAKTPPPDGLILGRSYLIHWSDSAYIKGWQYPDAGGVFPEPRAIHSLGWVVALARDYLVLAPNRTSDSEGFMNTLAIPRGCIESAEEIPHAN